ncbi:MAG TPA: DinB family protein [Vicinamibacterales bacterium]|nr:DinB family protein [Vicinamibacterales bacterium]
MGAHLPPDLHALEQAYAAAERDARAVVDGLTEALGTWRAEPSSWSVAECLDHLAVSNRIYLAAMEPSAAAARANGNYRQGPAMPGVIGRWFARTLEPPVKPRFKMKAPRKIRPRQSPPLGDATAAFLTTQIDVQRFLRTYAGIDLTGVRFPNPFITGVRFSLATGLHVIASHERRHLWQAWNVRRAAERAVTART